MSIQWKDYDVIIVGAGLSGCVMAERFASFLDKRVLILEKRNHIGGNCYDFIDENGILMNQYGAHIFHTDDDIVWEYINRFDRWIRWEHKVLGMIDNRFVPIPVNITTVNLLCDENLKNETEMGEWLRRTQIKKKTIANSEDVALERVGEHLYDKIFRSYTYKQWGCYPNELQPEVLARIPVRLNFDDRYFSDRYQALPWKGYTHFFRRLLDHPNIHILLDTDFLDVTEQIPEDRIIIYTGPIDGYFSRSGFEPLEYRSIRFVVERYKYVPFYQPNSVINHPSSETEYTRIVEYKHFLNQSSPHTTIVKEYSCSDGEPYYPILNQKNLTLYESYRQLALRAEKEKNIHFLGRLANYKYFNMDQAIKNALDYFKDRFESS